MCTSLCISSGRITNLLDYFGTYLFELDDMSTEVPQPMFVDFCSPALLGAIPLLLMLVANRLLAMMALSVVAARTLYSVKQKMRLRLSLPISLRWILDLPAINVQLGPTLWSA